MDRLYSREMVSYGDLYEINDFINMVSSGDIISDDGTGYFCKNGKISNDSNVCYLPSNLSEYIKDSTHIIWFNK